jgi:acyl-CoA thioesterase FadM
MDFRAPASLGDTLLTEIAVERYGSTSMTVGLTTSRLSDGTVVTEGREVIVFVDPDGFRPTPVPEAVKVRLGNPDTDDSVQ